MKHIVKIQTCTQMPLYSIIFMYMDNNHMHELAASVHFEFKGTYVSVWSIMDLNRAELD